MCRWSNRVLRNGLKSRPVAAGPTKKKENNHESETENGNGGWRPGCVHWRRASPGGAVGWTCGTGVWCVQPLAGEIESQWTGSPASWNPAYISVPEMR